MTGPNHTYCKHCGMWRDESKCRADPYINKEPREYCPVAKANPNPSDTADSNRAIVRK